MPNRLRFVQDEASHTVSTCFSLICYVVDCYCNCLAICVGGGQKRTNGEELKTNADEDVGTLLFFE